MGISRITRVGIAGFAYCTTLLSLSSIALASPSYTIQEIGLTGGNYRYGETQSDNPLQVNANGQVIGYSNRYSTSGSSLGQDTWLYNGSSTQEIGLTGTNYSYPDAGGVYQYSATSLADFNAAGQASGYSERFSSSGSKLGYDAWFYNGSSTQRIGLTGANYGYTTSGGTYQYSLAGQISATGQVIGYSDRFSSAGSSLGSDCWIYNGSSTQLIGLTGANYSYATSGGIYEANTIAGFTPSGQVVGASERYSSSGSDLGQDAWIYNGISMQQIVGLVGVNYSYSAPGGTDQVSIPEDANAAGQVSGISERFSSSGNSLGYDTWINSGGSAHQIGLTGGGYNYAASGGAYQDSYIQFMNAAGQVAGSSYRYTSSGGILGLDNWFYNGSSTQQIGLVGSIYSETTSGGTYEVSSFLGGNAAGQMIGYSGRFNGSGGNDSWFFNGSSTQQIGLTGTNYSYAESGGTYENSNPLKINATGQVIGYSDRFTSSGGNLGQDGWFFDPATDMTSLLQFSVDSATGYSDTDPEILTDTGVVLGSYELYSGSVDDGQHMFYWSESNGFSDLGALVSGGLSSQGCLGLYSVLAADGTAADGSPLFISGVGDHPDENSAYIMSQIVPEPVSGTILLVVAPAAFLRRSRSSEVSKHLR